MFEPVSGDARLLYQNLLGAFARGEWDGDVDGWADGVDDGHWRNVTTDHRGCASNRCGFFRQCPFFKSRGAPRQSRRRGCESRPRAGRSRARRRRGVVGSRGHDLRARRSPSPARQDAATLHVPAASARDVAMARSGQRERRYAGAARGTPRGIAGAGSEHHDGDGRAWRSRCARWPNCAAGLDYVVRDDDRSLCRFRLGQIPLALGDLAGPAAKDMDALANCVDAVHQLLQEVVDGQRSWEHGHEAEDWLGVVGQHVNRALGTSALLADYCAGTAYRAGASVEPGPRARWITRIVFDGGDDFELVSAPMQPGELLEEALWSQAYAVICTSATLTALGRFDRFLERAGLADDVLVQRIPSPFDFPRIATFDVPRMTADPRDASGAYRRSHAAAARSARAGTQRAGPVRVVATTQRSRSTAGACAGRSAEGTG